MRTTIRRARRTDVADLTRIAHAAKRYWGYPERLIRRWEADLTVTQEVVARAPVYCAAQGRRVVAFYALSGERGTRELEHMWVDPRHIGCGIGRRLFRHLLRRLRATRVGRLRIASDPNAEGFYRRMGARRIGRVSSMALAAGLGLAWLALYHECASGGAMAGRYRTCTCRGFERVDFDATAADGPRRTVCIGWVTSRTCYRSRGGPEIPCGALRP